MLLYTISLNAVTFTPLAPVGVEGQNIIFTCSLPGGQVCCNVGGWGRARALKADHYFPVSHLTQVPNLERMLPDGSFPIINTDPRVSVVVNQNVNVVFTIQNLNSSQDNGSVWRCSLGALTSPVATLTVQSEFIYYASECIPTFFEFTTFFPVLAPLHIIDNDTPVIIMPFNLFSDL